MRLRGSRFCGVRLGFSSVRLGFSGVRLGFSSVSFALGGVGFVRTVMTAIEFADFGPGMPFTASRPYGEGPGQSLRCTISIPWRASNTLCPRINRFHLIGQDADGRVWHWFMNRIDATFAKLREQETSAFVAYIAAGDPNLDATFRIVEAMERWGVDIVELGVPFSDPMADGTVNQLAAERALKAGTTVAGVLDLVRRIRRRRRDPHRPLQLHEPDLHLRVWKVFGGAPTRPESMASSSSICLQKNRMPTRNCERGQTSALFA